MLHDSYDIHIFCRNPCSHPTAQNSNTFVPFSELEYILHQLRDSREGMLFLQRVDAFLYEKKLLKAEVDPEEGDDAQEKQAANLTLLTLEHSLLKMAATEACQGVCYFLCMKLDDNKAVVRYVDHHIDICALFSLSVSPSTTKSGNYSFSQVH